MKKLITAFLVAIATAVFACSFTAFALTDIKNHNYETAIKHLQDGEMIQGYADNTFKPDRPLNRAEFVKMIVNSHYNAEDIEEENLKNCFPDVTDQWFAKYVCFAKKHNIIGGYPDGFFKPERTINFSEAAKITVLTKELDYSENSKNWYQGYVDALQKNKYVPQSVKSAGSITTRGEFAELLWRILEEKKDLPTSNLSWETYSKDGFSFDHPNWVGYERHGWMYLSDELKNIEGLDTKNYIQVDHYLATYNLSASESLSDYEALDTQVWFGHPRTDVQSKTINGLPALRREYHASPGDVINGRTIGYDEIIIVYTYRNGRDIKVMQYFNAHPPTQDEFVADFEEIAQTVRAD